MTREQVISAYAKLSREDQSYLLARLSHELTVCVRGCYSSAPQVVNSRAGSPVGAINEIQHQLSAHIGHLIKNDGKRYPDDVFIQTVFFWSQTQAGLEEELIRSFERAGLKEDGSTEWPWLAEERQ